MGDDPRVGQLIDGRFRVLRPRGRGGMGAVYEGEHVELGKPVAIKFMHREGGAREEEVERFRREARAASRVNHPNVVQIYDAGTVEALDELYIVMELVDGADLRTVVQREGALAPARVLALATGLLDGLHAIHEAGIVHRDIKPANLVVLADGGGVKIMDFGISKAVGGSTRLTQTGRVVGSPQFMAPEQIAGAEVDRRADIYAAGVTLYQLIVGDVPFAELEYTKLVIRHLRDEVPSLAIAKPGTPPAIVEAVARALQKDPAQRFPTATAFAAALRGKRPSAADLGAAARRSQPTILARPRRPSQPPPPEATAHKIPWLVAGVIVGAGGLALALALAITRHRAGAPATAPIAPPLVAAAPPIAPLPVVVPVPVARDPEPPPPPPATPPPTTLPKKHAAPATTPEIPTVAGAGSGSGSGAGSASSTGRGGPGPRIDWPSPAPEAWVPADGGGLRALEIQSIPIGAHVWIDGKAAGEAPLRLEHVGAGPHKLHFALVGYQSTDADVEMHWTEDVGYVTGRLQLLVNSRADHRVNPY